jgi:hypothetical protein
MFWFYLLSTLREDIFFTVYLRIAMTYRKDLEDIPITGPVSRMTLENDLNRQK